MLTIFAKYLCVILREFQVFLALAGLLSIAMAIIFTYGVGFGTGIMFGPIHQITPFMLLGKRFVVSINILHTYFFWYILSQCLYSDYSLLMGHCRFLFIDR